MPFWGLDGLGLTPRKELEGQMSDLTVGLQARMMSLAMRKLVGALNRTQTLCLLTNQIRESRGALRRRLEVRRALLLRAAAPRAGAGGGQGVPGGEPGDRGGADRRGDLTG
jgi:RecA/RadA recombinase